MSPLNLSPGAAIDRLRQRDGVGRRCDAATLRAGIAFDQHRQLEPSAGHGGDRPSITSFEVRHDFDVGPTGERNEAIKLRLTDEIVGQQDVGDARVDHDLGLAKLLAIHALRAELDLQMREFRNLVRLDVRAKAKP